MNLNLHVNKTNLHMKGFALGLIFETEAKGYSEVTYYVYKGMT